MKKLTMSVLLALTMTTAAQAQTRNRNMVLIEEFTNTGCSPCADYSPTLDSMISYRLGQVAAVKYHGTYPDPNDPFYLDQKTDLDKRISYYGIKAYPTVILNGQQIPDMPSPSEFFLGYYIDYFHSKARHYDILLNTYTADHKLSVTATVTPDVDVDDASQLRLYVMPVEEFYESPTMYGNGEKEMRYTMRRMLPDADGYALGSSLKANTVYTYQTECSLDNFYDERQLGVVAFLQNTATQEVLATAYVAREATTENDLCIMNLVNTPDYICSPNFYGQLTIRNNGGNTITSATLNVSVNGQLTTRPWTGSLSYLDKDTVSIEGITDFQLATDGNNSVKVWLSDINGSQQKSNEWQLEMKNAVQAKNSVRLKFYTDNCPRETTWKLLNEAGDVLQEGGPYEQKKTYYTTDFDLRADGCYTLEFYDSGKNGIRGEFGNGGVNIYQVTTDGTEKRLAYCYYYGEYFALSFHLSDAQPTAIESVVSTVDENARVSVYDVQGRLLSVTTMGDIKRGALPHSASGILVLGIQSHGTYKMIKVKSEE